MKKWVTTLALVGTAVAVGLVVRQIVQDLSTDAELWQSVTDTPALD
ncbi:hypothetical protein I6B53_00045 [Schaalia sp. 19OD2882]|nr:DLW-39 family protein [Schaalia sp. 19OD2882]QWW19581.1 hypothetical protein I6B53_00045 [Schaalia sp. 19OD2882]